MKMMRSQVMVMYFFSLSLFDHNIVQVKTKCILFHVVRVHTPSTLSRLSTLSKLHLLVFKIFTCPVSISNTVLLILSFFPSPSPHFLSPRVHCVCVHRYAFFWGWGGFYLPLLAAGDYCPWDRELQSGLWLEKHLTDEDDVGTFKGSSRSACRCVCSNFERDI